MTAVLAVVAVVRPGVLTSAARSPVAWAVAFGVLLAGLGVRALVTRAGGSRGVAAAASTATVLAMVALLVAPSFRERTLVEDFPTVPAAVLAAPTTPAPASPAPSEAPAAAPVAPSPAAVPTPQGPVLGASGGLDGIDHRASGVTALYSVDGAGVLRFEDVAIEGTVAP